jgi:hypothetical protein
MSPTSLLTRLPLSVVAAALLLTTDAGAQTIRPLVSEFAEKGRGRFELVNESIWPLDVVLQTRGFTVSDEGELIDRPLTAPVDLKLSAMNVRVPAGQGRWVFFEASGPQLPAWFVVYAIFSGFPNPENGIQVQVELPHVVYLLPKATLRDRDITARLVEFTPGLSKAVIEVHNNGRQFGRILTSEVRSTSSNAASISFPLLPGGTRRLTVRWDAAEAPSSVVLKGRGFEFERSLTPSP